MSTTKLIKKLPRAEFKSRNKVPIWLTAKHVYHAYRYKKRWISQNSNGTSSVHAPYIKKEDSTNHEFSLIYPKWQLIIEEYFKVVFEHLMNAKDVELPKYLGHLSMYKWKPNNIIVRGGKMFRSLNTMGYMPFMLWHRGRMKNFNTKFWYVFNFSRKKIWPMMGKKLTEEPSTIFNYPDIRKYKK